MTNQQLNEVEEDLRVAARSQSVEDIVRLSTLYCQSAEVYARTLSMEPARLRTLTDRVQETLQWTRLMAATLRAQWAADLNQVAVVQHYFNASPENPPKTNFQA